jgi:hypothetical protein
MSVLKLWIIYISVFLSGIISFAIMINNAPNPESLILGEWGEMAWEYEKVDMYDGSIRKKEIPDDLKKQIGQDLIIHEAETWVFLPNRKLKLIAANGTEKIVDWVIKGRGNILQLKHDDFTVENFNLTYLNDDSMVLNIELDVQARGIAKLTFEKIK